MNFIWPAFGRLRADGLEAHMQAQTASLEHFATRIAHAWELWGKVVRDNNLIMK